MNAESFVEAVHAVVYQSTLDGLRRSIASPPGRAPRPRLVALSEWFNALDPASQLQALELMRHTADAVVFSMMTVLDGASKIDADASEVEVKVGGQVVNGDGDLYVHFRWLVDQELDGPR